MVAVRIAGGRKDVAGVFPARRPRAITKTSAVPPTRRNRVRVPGGRARYQISMDAQARRVPDTIPRSMYLRASENCAEAIAQPPHGEVDRGSDSLQPRRCAVASRWGGI